MVTGSQMGERFADFLSNYLCHFNVFVVKLKVGQNKYCECVTLDFFQTSFFFFFFTNQSIDGENNR